MRDRVVVNLHDAPPATLPPNLVAHYSVIRRNIYADIYAETREHNTHYNLTL